jgi:hypothetical protein
MSIREPSPEALEAIDWDALRDIEDRAQALSKNGPTALEVFRALWAEGLKATGGHAEMLSTVRTFAPPGWADDL